MESFKWPLVLLSFEYMYMLFCHVVRHFLRRKEWADRQTDRQTVRHLYLVIKLRVVPSGTNRDDRCV